MLFFSVAPAVLNYFFLRDRNEETSEKGKKPSELKSTRLLESRELSGFFKTFSRRDLKQYS